MQKLILTIFFSFYFGITLMPTTTFAEDWSGNLELLHRQEAQIYSVSELRDLNEATIKEYETEPPPASQYDAIGRALMINQTQVEKIYNLLKNNPVAGFDRLAIYDSQHLNGFCFGRSFYVSLELYRHNLASSAIRKVTLVGGMANNARGNTEVSDNSTQSFTYHMATAVRGEDGVWWVIDNNMQRVATLRRWYEIFSRFTDTNARIYLSPFERLSANIAELEIPDLNAPDFGFDFDSQNNWSQLAKTSSQKVIKTMMRIFNEANGKSKNSSNASVLLDPLFNDYFIDMIRYFKTHPVAEKDKFAALPIHKENPPKIDLNTAPVIPLRLIFTIDWMGKSLIPENLEAIKNFRENMQRLLGVEVKFVHFLNASYFTDPMADPSKTRDLLRSIMQKGDEIGANDFISESLVEQAEVNYRESSQSNPANYPLKLRRKIIATSLKILMDQGFGKINTFRAADWMLTKALIPVLGELGIQVDNSLGSADIFKKYLPEGSPIQSNAIKIGPTIHTWNQRPFIVKNKTSGPLIFAPMLAQVDLVPADDLYLLLKDLMDSEAEAQQNKAVLKSSHTPTFVLGLRQETFATYGPILFATLQKLVGSFAPNLNPITPKENLWGLIKNKIKSSSITTANLILPGKNPEQKGNTEIKPPSIFYQVEIGTQSLTEALALPLAARNSFNGSAMTKLPKTRILHAELFESSYQDKYNFNKAEDYSKSIYCKDLL